MHWTEFDKLSKEDQSKRRQSCVDCRLELESDENLLNFLLARLGKSRAELKAEFREYLQPTFPLGKLAYEAYSAYRSDKAHDGLLLPKWDELAKDNKAAWEAFATTALSGESPSRAYIDSCLDTMQGKFVSGSPAPSWAFLFQDRSEVADAWFAAWACRQRQESAPGE